MMLLAVAAGMLALQACCDVASGPKSFLTTGFRATCSPAVSSGLAAKIVKPALVTPASLDVLPLCLLGSMALYYTCFAKQARCGIKVALRPAASRTVANSAVVCRGVALANEVVLPRRARRQQSLKARKDQRHKRKLARQLPCNGFLGEAGQKRPKRALAGITPLMLAAIKGETKRLKELAREGDINEKDDFGHTALHYAVDGLQHGAAKALLDIGADIDLAAKSGKTPLMLAVRSNAKFLVALLLKEGADVTATDKDGLTAADHGRRRGPEGAQVRKMLQTAGAINHRKEVVAWLKKRPYK